MIIYDTETTGFEPGQICQLSYIIANKGQTAIAKNYFFTVNNVEPAAEKVHGFSKEKLQQLSNNLIFGDHVAEIKADFEGRIAIAHNINFDNKFLNKEFERCKLKPNIKKQYCTMKHFTERVGILKNNGPKWPSLAELTAHLCISPEQILMSVGKIFKTSSVGFHDARFDTVAVYEVLKIAFNKKMKEVESLKR